MPDDLKGPYGSSTSTILKGQAHYASSKAHDVAVIAEFGGEAAAGSAAGLFPAVSQPPAQIHHQGKIHNPRKGN